jgi:hypothetical protein
MNSDWIVNPYTQIVFKDKYSQWLFDSRPDADYFLKAPVPHEELKFTGISKSEQPELYELFLDLQKTQINDLDVEHDLNAKERDFLFGAGVLVEEDKAPHRPLFYCLLDEVEAKDFDRSPDKLVVNPSFYFEAFRFENLAVWINERHLSPNQPTVWIERPVSRIRLGYWLDNSQAQIISKFQAGCQPPAGIEPELAAKLFEAEILIHPERHAAAAIEERKIIEQARASFGGRKYSVLRELLPPVQMSAMRRFYRQYVEQGFMPFGDSQVDRRFRQMNEPLARFFHRNFNGLMSQIVGEQVKPSYVYAASYKEFADLKPHTDRKQCELSISFQVDYQPENRGSLSPWALFIKQPDFPIDFDKPVFHPHFPAEDQASENNPPIFLANGDALFYKGCEVIHYRYPLPAGHQSTSLFFHYVPENYADDLLL